VLFVERNLHPEPPFTIHDGMMHVMSAADGDDAAGADVTAARIRDEYVGTGCQAVTVIYVAPSSPTHAGTHAVCRYNRRYDHLRKLHSVVRCKSCGSFMPSSCADMHRAWCSLLLKAAAKQQALDPAAPS
jgi:hypothetical protein